MSTVLVTGGQGFLGTHLVRRFHELGYRVRVLTRGPAAGEGMVHGDIRDPGAVSAAVAGADLVVHLVSNFRKGGSDKEEAHAINVQGTRNVLDACVAHGVGRLVHCSTIGVHGDVLSIPADEETPFNPGDLYQETKLLAEQEVWRTRERTGLPVTVVRPISLYGPGDLRMLKLFRMIQRRVFVLFGSGRALFQPAYIDDVVDGFVLCTQSARAEGEAFILGGAEYLPLGDLAAQIARKLDVPPPRLRLPLAPVQALATLCEEICVPLGIEPPLHRRRVSFFRNNRAFSIAKAERLLGFAPKVPLEEGLERTIAWYRRQGLL